MVTLVNRAKVATATTGTGTITLGSAESGYQTFANAGVVNSDVVRYVIEDGDAWEIGLGTYTASGTTLTRGSIESSNADAALNLTGNAVVYASAAAADLQELVDFADNFVLPTSDGSTGQVLQTNGAGTLSFTTISGYTDADVDTHLNTGTASSGEVLSWTGSDYDWVAVSGGTALELYAENPSSPTAPSATGTNAVAIGNGPVSAGSASVALGRAYASGTDSFAAAIANNTSSYGATGANSVAMGQSAKATAAWSFAYGRNSQSTSSYSVVLGGYSSSATKDYAYAFGHRASADVIGKYAYGVYSSADVGTSQGGYYVLALNTTDATSSSLVTNGGTNAASTTNQIILPNNSAYAFHGTIVARQQASQGTASAAWKIEGLIRREGSAGTTVLVNSATTVLDNTPAWGMALSADTTNGGLKIEATGAAATNIRWVATINTSEVTY